MTPPPPSHVDDLHTFLRSRRSIRRFKADPSTGSGQCPVPAHVIERILVTATHAPSAHNLQPWRFVLVGRNGIPPKVGRNGIPPEEGRIGNPPHAARDRLARALTSALRRDMTAAGAPEAEIEARLTRSARRIHEAPVLILLCRDRTAVREHKREDEIMAIQSVANAATYLLLAAHAEGLGGNWICWPLYAQDETRLALDLPADWEPQAMIFLGCPDETPPEKTLKPLEEVVVSVQ